MIPALFQNAQFLLVAAALISVPIIIHLINRMRFKRIRWAAMEFLLKAQKRTRRRLIIEQLLLLALRCFLIALVGLLVSRFIGCGDNNLGGKPNLHLVLLDDTLSMQDHWKGPEGVKNCFDVAKRDFLIEKIAKGLAKSKTTDQLIIVPFSKLADDGVEYEPKIYEKLGDSGKMKELVSDITDMQPSMLSVSHLRAVKTAQRIIGKHTKSRITLHILSDFRDVDWGGKNGELLTNELLEMVNVNKEIRIRPIDTVHPDRTANQGGYPPANDNVGIIDFRPDTRIAGHKMPVTFTVKIANFSGKLVEVKLTARNETMGKDMEDVDFDLKNSNPQKDRTRIELAPNNVTDVTFEYGDVKRGLFFPNLQEGQSDFAHISVRLTNAAKQPLENDAILADNIRHTVLEVRDKVPILVVDGLREASRKGEGKDSFVLDRVLPEVPGKSYQMIFGDQLPGCAQDAAKALERYDLNKYPTIFMLNVPLLKPEQVANLETYVKNGGGVCFYMGPDVSAKHYNEKLYRGGEGVFPAPLKTSYYPPQNEPELPTKKDNDVFELITREDKFGSKPLPIFSRIFFEPKQRFPLMNLPIHRYYKVDRGAWKQDASRVFELATLPNDALARDFDQRVADITQTGVNAKEVLKNTEFTKYKDQLLKHFRDIEEKVKAGSEFKAYHLANQIEIMLSDKGSDNPPIPDLTKFWSSGDDKVQLLKKQFTDLKEDVNYGDPFIVMQNYGKGKVIAVMSTCGRDWNDWAGGSMSQVLFPAFIWEMQNELSSPGEEGNLTVGTTLPPLTFDARQFQGERLKLVRYFVKTSTEKPGESGEKIEQFSEEKDGKIPFKMTNHLLPGLYMSELYKADAEKPIARYAHTFNVDTSHEGRLQRVGDELKNLEDKANEITKSKDTIRIVSQNMLDEVLVAKSDDLSESPWLFLVLLLVLVAEQALAVHLSFHLKDNEGDLTPAGVKP